METKKEIEVLNSLVEINNDRIEGYKNAGEETDSNSLKDMFVKFKRTSEICREQLAEEIRRCGGTPEEGTKTTGKLYRAYMDLKAAITGKDHKAILNSCEYGEDKALETYEDVLKNDSEDLNINQLNLVKSQYDMIKKNHDVVKAMRDTELVS